MRKRILWKVYLKAIIPYSANEIKEAVIKAGVLVKKTTTKKITYYNTPIAFDIETTSFHSNGNKCGIMYIWTLAINEVIIQGRTWEEFVRVINFFEEWYELDNEHRLVIYIHNLAFEFQFLHKWFTFTEVFSLKERQPIRAVTNQGIEFRCSYKLSGYSLSKLGEQLTKHNIRKLIGDLDYNKVRNSKTKLTQKELDYCYNDVLIITEYIDEYLNRVRNIGEIPMTKTGEVRQYTRNKCFYGDNGRNNDKYKQYKKLISSLVMSAEDYQQLKRAFAGGFTHANALWTNEIINNVRSFDFTSSYPYVMISEKFPMSEFKKVAIRSEEELQKYLKNYCCLFDIEFENISPRLYHENYISKSHCSKLINAKENNGRISSADVLRTTITELDFLIIARYYKWDKMKIGNFKIAYKAYLPTDFVKTILELYNNKTTLKDVIGKEVEYLQSKERINSEFGMTVTDPCRDIIEYNPLEWKSETPNIEETINKHNKSKKRFLYYAWGIWVTAYARYNLFTAITELGDDYIYADTDSVKFVNYENHKDYFDKYNRIVSIKLNKAMQYHKLDIELTRPKTIKGKEKPIGIWDDEGTYTRFKTLGAKRYMIEKKNAWLYKLKEWTEDLPKGSKIIEIDNEKYISLDINITVSGLNKSKAVPFLVNNYKDVFKAFDNELYVPDYGTGKLTHTYNDEEIEGYITDYQGNTAYYHELSSINLEGADYSLSMNELYVAFCLGRKEMEI